jgi:hypothetical protein
MIGSSVERRTDYRLALFASNYRLQGFVMQVNRVKMHRYFGFLVLRQELATVLSNVETIFINRVKIQ